MKMNVDRIQLMNYINEVSFALDDVCLYLDTHPCDHAALDYYEQCKNARKQAVNQYTQCFGPLLNEDVEVGDGCSWAWVQNPWPWEGGC